MIEDKFKLEYQAFPDPMAPSEVIEKEEYGLQWANAISYQWFHRQDGHGSKFQDRRHEYHRLRTYARGDHDTNNVKQILVGGDKQSYSNYSWEPIQVVPKFVKLIVNQMSERLFEIQANATDSYSSEKRDSYRKNLENMMVSKDMLMKAKELHGVNMLPDDPNDIPDSQEEIDLRMKLKYKQNAEIAAETAIRFTLDLNDFDEVQSRVIEDIATIGEGGTKRYTDIHKGIVVDYVDPADMIYSFSNSRDFKNVYYYGEVERITLGELRRIMRASGKELNDDEYNALGKSVHNWATYQGESNNRTYREGDIEGMMADVLHFTFEANDRTVYKKKYNRKSKGYKLSKKESTFSKGDPNHLSYDVVKKDRKVWYEGTLILGTEILVSYKKATNMVVEKGQINRPLPKYTMYAPEIYQGQTKSLVGRVIQYVDLMQQTHIKIQQMVAKARPAGIYIDVAGLEDIPMGDGNTLTPLEVIKIYDETGNVIGSSSTAGGEYNYGKEPIRELKNGVIDGIDRLVNVYNFYLNQLRDSIGIPQGADASNPHPDTLVGVQKVVALNSNTATRHILDAALHITKRTAIGVNLNLKDIFKYSNLREFYTNAIGKINVDILESLKNYHLHDFGIIISLKPDAEQKQYLEGNIQAALAKELITLDDAMEIRDVSNIKLASELLKLRRQKREKEKKEHEKAMVEVNAKANGDAAERASAAKQQEIQAEMMSKMEHEKLKGQNAIAKIHAEEQAKARLMEKEFYYNITLKGLEEELGYGLREEEEKRSIRLQDKKDQNASRLLAQKLGAKKTPMTFESSEDNISGGVESSELEPS